MPGLILLIILLELLIPAIILKIDTAKAYQSIRDNELYIDEKCSRSGGIDLSKDIKELREENGRLQDMMNKE